MADTKISALTDGATALASDRIPVARDPTGTPVSRYVTPAYIRTYLLGLANAWAATQTITPAVNTNALVVTGYSLTGANDQSLVDLAGTWNTTGEPTAFKLNITNTASNAEAKLMDLQLGGVSQFRVSKAGRVYASVYSGTAGASTITIATDITLYNPNNGRPVNLDAPIVNVTGILGIGQPEGAVTGSADLTLSRDAAHILAQRNGVNAQAFRLYNTFTDAANYERAVFGFNVVTDRLTIGPQAAGTGVLRSIGFTSHVLWNADNAHDIGAPGASRPRAIYTGSGIFSGSEISVGPSNTLNWGANRASLFAPTANAIRILVSSGDAQLNFGGDAAAFPALKRSATALQARLADDSAFAPLQGLLRTHANAVAESITPTHTLTLYDASGTAYKVAVQAA